MAHQMATLVVFFEVLQKPMASEAMAIIGRQCDIAAMSLKFGVQTWFVLQEFHWHLSRPSLCTRPNWMLRLRANRRLHSLTAWNVSVPDNQRLCVCAPLFHPNGYIILWRNTANFTRFYVYCCFRCWQPMSMRVNVCDCSVRSSAVPSQLGERLLD